MFPTGSRCLFLGQPSPAACGQLATRLEQLGLAARLGDDLFAPTNWHQSLSDRFADEPHLVEQLRRAGNELQARAVRFRMDRIESRPDPEGVHWAFMAGHTPADFALLLRSLGRGITNAIGRKAIRPTAHITVSYWAPEHFSRMIPFEPVEWLLDEVLLVRGGGRPYAYGIIERWPLQPPRIESAAEQRVLF